MSKLRVLFIDDDSKSVLPAMKWVRKTHESDCIPFGEFAEAIARIQPHIAVVDRFEGTPNQGMDEGAGVFEAIWTRRFCPIVFYSAFPEHDPDERKKHPFVKHVTKGADLKEFQAAIECLLPHAQAIEDAEQHIRQQFAVAMREVAPYAAEFFTDPGQMSQAVTRHGRRRLAALMDEMSLGKLACWEQYIHPPVVDDLLLGDVLRLKSESKDKPESFCIVLTPSCDLVKTNGRNPKVKQVLVAGCCGPKQGIQSTPLCKTHRKELPEVLTSTLLTPGYYQRIIPLPALKGKIPSMVADLKDLRQIPCGELEFNDKSKYERVASIDSPSRELISWAYMQTACRPGLPERDYGSWNKEIMETYGT